MSSAGRLTGELLVRKGGALPSYSNTVETANDGIHSITNAATRKNGRRLKAVPNDEPQQQAGISADISQMLNGFSKRVAMTLRLDEERHLKLRLLSALNGKSCQKLLIDALDQYIDEQADHLDPQIWQRLNSKK